MNDQENCNSSNCLKITQQQKAILSSLSASLPKQDQRSFSDYVTLGVENWNRHTTKDSVFYSTCLPNGFKGSNFLTNRDPGDAGQKFRDILNIPPSVMQIVVKARKEFERRWIFTSGDFKGTIFSLEGDLGLAKCIFGAAMHYLINTKFKNFGGEVLFDVDKKGSYLMPGDKISFWLCEMYTRSDHTGRMNRRRVTIDVNTRKVKVGQQAKLDQVMDKSICDQFDKEIQRTLDKANNCQQPYTYDKEYELSM